MLLMAGLLLQSKFATENDNKEFKITEKLRGIA